MGILCLVQHASSQPGGGPAHQVASGLLHAHLRRVCHHNLKPANVMLRNNGQSSSHLAGGPEPIRFLARALLEPALVPTASVGPGFGCRCHATVLQQAVHRRTAGP